MKSPKHNNFPEFPRTPYLKGGESSWEMGDIVLDRSVTPDVLGDPTLVIEEKLDGANVRVMFNGKDPPLVGNREHVLKKGYIKRETPAKLQFRPLWNWVYDHRDAFKRLTRDVGENAIVYGEWLHAQHTVRYDALPTRFAALDILLEDGFMDRRDSRKYLERNGFTLPPIYDVRMPTIEILDALARGKSMWGAEPMEGLYLRTGDGVHVTGRYKYVRTGFKPRKDFNETGLVLNRVVWEDDD